MTLTYTLEEVRKILLDHYEEWPGMGEAMKEALWEAEREGSAEIVIRVTKP